MARGGGGWRLLAEREGSLEERSSACECGLLITTRATSITNNHSNNNTSTITNIIEEGRELGREVECLRGGESGMLITETRQT